MRRPAFNPALPLFQIGAVRVTRLAGFQVAIHARVPLAIDRPANPRHGLVAAVEEMRISRPGDDDLLSPLQGVGEHGRMLCLTPSR